MEGLSVTEKDYLVIPSCVGLLDCFNTQPCSYAGDADSLCHLLQQEDRPISNIILLGLFSYLYHNRNLYGNEQADFKTEDFRKWIGYSRGGKSFDIKQELLRFNDVQFWWQGSDAKQVAQVKLIGRTTRIKSLYFKNVFLAMKALTERELITKSGFTIRRHTSAYVSLVKASIVSDSNKSAIEIVIELCKLVERRGTHYHSSAHITAKTLIDRCATLRWKIETAKDNSRKNQIVRDDFSRALLLLESKTTLYEAYIDVSIKVVGKLSVTDTGKIIVKHKGKKSTISIRKERKLKNESR